MIATMPYFQDETGSETLRKAQAMKRTIAKMTKMIATTDFHAASAPRVGPIVLKPTTCIEGELIMAMAVVEPILIGTVEVAAGSSAVKVEIREFFWLSVSVVVRISYSFDPEGMTEAERFNVATAAITIL